MTEKTTKAVSNPEPEIPAESEPVRVQWKDERLKSTYCNVCNATSTREEVVLNFGANSSWDRTQTLTEVDLEHRIVMSPFVAKRLSQLLAQMMADYEARFGTLDPNPANASPAQAVPAAPSERPH